MNPSPLHPMTPNSDTSSDYPALIFVNNSPAGRRYLVDGLGFVADSIDEATRFPIIPHDRSILWSPFERDWQSVTALICLEPRQLHRDEVTLGWGPHQWRVPIRNGQVRLQVNLIPILQWLNVTGGPFGGGVRVLWRDSGRFVSNFPFRKEIHPALPVASR